MQFKKGPIEGLILIQHKNWEDSRGAFMEMYNKELFAKNGIRERFVQDNLSVSHKGVLRGLHAQGGAHAQGKLVRVLKGRVWDVAVDIRVDSPSYGQHQVMELSADQHVSFWIPQGFLHGFLCLEDETIFTYKVTGLYDPSGELGVRYDDPDLGISWPKLDIPYIISEKDKSLPLLKSIKSPFKISS
jgi:dTDP-4-dehydrorhamnose 3,5-epimerase